MSGRLVSAMARVLEHTDGSMEAEDAVLHLSQQSVVAFIESVRARLLLKVDDVSPEVRELVEKFADIFKVPEDIGGAQYE